MCPFHIHFLNDSVHRQEFFIHANSSASSKSLQKHSWLLSTWQRQEMIWSHYEQMIKRDLTRTQETAAVISMWSFTNSNPSSPLKITSMVSKKTQTNHVIKKIWGFFLSWKLGIKHKVWKCVRSRKTLGKSIWISPQTIKWWQMNIKIIKV